MKIITAMRRRVLFYRDFRRFSGGHLKVWDYYNHVKKSRDHEPQIYFSKKSVWDQSNPWFGEREHLIDSWRVSDADILFLAGMDWLVLKEEQRERASVPIINLIQHIRHADPKDKRYPFLRHKAIRICVSEEVANALRDSEKVNGPIFTIPNGIILEGFPETMGMQNRNINIFIVGMKQRMAARRLRWRIRWHIARRVWPSPIRIDVLLRKIPRHDFLQKLGQAKITVFLPNETEGFYLPALEGMAMQTQVVCPDCIGNRSFCLPGLNCFRPDYREDAIVEAVKAVIDLSPEETETLISNALDTVAKYSSESERESFMRILDCVDQIW